MGNKKLNYFASNPPPPQPSKRKHSGEKTHLNHGSFLKGSGKREQPPAEKPEFRVELLLFGNGKKEDFLHIQAIRFALEVWKKESIPR